MAYRKLLTIGVFVSAMLVGGQAFSASSDRRIVTFASGVLRLMQRNIVELSGSEVIQELGIINGLAIQLPADAPDGAVAFLLNHELVTGVFDDLLTVVNSVDPLPSDEEPQDEIYPWGLDHTRVKAVHEVWLDDDGLPYYDGRSVKIAILDTGIDTHSELGSAIAGGYNALPGGGSHRDRHGHGTHMAGIIAANLDAQGIVGAAYRAQIYAVKVLDDDGTGRTSNIIKGLEWVAGRGMDVVNMSLGFWGDNKPLKQAVDRLYDQGVIMVAAAGNKCSYDPGQEEGGGDEGENTTSGCDAIDESVKSPARYDTVIAVGATNDADKVTDYSLKGPKVDVVAPGGERSGQRILSTYLDDRYGWLSGTSPAAAHVSGIVASLLQDQQHSFGEVRDLLRIAGSATSIVDAEASVAAANP